MSYKILPGDHESLSGDHESIMDDHESLTGQFLNIFSHVHYERADFLVYL
jgi:hypothetical protein